MVWIRLFARSFLLRIGELPRSSRKISTKMSKSTKTTINLPRWHRHERRTETHSWIGSEREEGKSQIQKGKTLLSSTRYLGCCILSIFKPLKIARKREFVGMAKRTPNCFWGKKSLPNLQRWIKMSLLVWIEAFISRRMKLRTNSRRMEQKYRRCLGFFHFM